MSTMPRSSTRGLWNWSTLTLGRAVVATLATLAILAAGAFGVYKLANPSLSCAVGVQQRGPQHECTGVTDGTYPFAPQLAAVESAISKEDHRIDRPQYATIALLLPFTSTDPSVQAAVLHAVQGAYIAQYSANHLQNDHAPPIRLVLANPGLGSTQWLPVAEQLESMADGPGNLRAVIGIGASTTKAQREVRWLTGQGIPVVGGAITADDIANRRGRDLFPGLVRVAPTNSEEAAALTHFDNAQPSQSLLVEDMRTGDNYITTLRTAFARLLATAHFEPEQFTSPPDINQNGTISNLFSQMVQSICDMQPYVEWLYFAGRQVQLRQFVNELSKRSCSDQKFTVRTGDVASHLANDPELSPDAFGNGVTLEYAALASPGAWPASGAPPTGGSHSEYLDFSNALKAQADLIGPVDLTDGQTIISYDSALTAITAIWLAAGTPQMPSTQDIVNEWRSLNGPHKVLGASGWICLDNVGNPYDKAIPIVRYDGNRSPRFVAIAWPTGSPPTRTCIAPSGA